ncbi:hypothetical protein M4I32_12950 [Microbacterium sp. LRZ72]|uniref:F510_1955 family glycosylhydrolase n=1 Tax=Microbacterium sp. LRZ72 TaxID=2942481 RepID=UPI0029BCAC2B|nr:hypothetical protein [Microbacterium sp. LRZ72]MDX2377710.1 hypothetical protein [Microbacterium sp. LRZ72]
MITLIRHRVPGSTRRKYLQATVVASLAAIALVGCSSPQSEADPTTAPPLDHVHGIVSDPDSAGILIATHVGIYRLDGMEQGGEMSGPVGGLDFDAMGITSTADTLYASGHPGPTTPDEFGSPNLGLIRSDDSALTWQTVSLSGEADFHELTATRDGTDFIYGLQGEQLRRSDDGGQTWIDLPPIQARDIVVSPGAASTLYATTEAGLAVSNDGGNEFVVDASAPIMYVISAGPERGLVGVDLNGTIRHRDGASSEWSSGGTIAGAAQAFTYLEEAGMLLVADDRGVRASEDFGLTWEMLVPR